MTVQRSAFASLVDALMEEQSAREAGGSAHVSANFIGLDGQSGSAGIPEGKVAAEYLLSAVRDEVERDFVETLSRIEISAPPSLDPGDIARELGLDSDPPKPRDYDRLRREFAFANHPDRVGEPMREHAKIRMQIANRLIDEAKSSGSNS